MSDISKTAKVVNKVILATITSTSHLNASEQYHLFMIFAVYKLSETH